MKDELIKWETGKLAKEKGLNWPVLYCFFEDGTLFNQTGYHNFNVSETLVSACSQSLLQRWLREVHDIHIEISVFKYKGFSKLHYDYTIFHEDPKEPYEESCYNSYENALEDALIYALNLIP
jgi:hypothetical protein